MKVIAILPSEKHCGVSTLAINLSASFPYPHRVLIIDCCPNDGVSDWFFNDTTVLFEDGHFTELSTLSLIPNEGFYLLRLGDFQGFVNRIRKNGNSVDTIYHSLNRVLFNYEFELIINHKPSAKPMVRCWFHIISNSRWRNK